MIANPVAYENVWTVTYTVPENGEVRYLRFGSSAAGMIQWTLDQAKAVQFAREEDAAATVIFCGLVYPENVPVPDPKAAFVD